MSTSAVSTSDGTIEYIEKKNGDSSSPKLRINFNNEGKSVVVPVSASLIVNELIDLIKSKFQRLHGSKIQGDKLYNEKGSLLDGDDLVGDVLGNDQLVRFEKKKTIKNTSSNSKTLTTAAAASKAEAQKGEEKKVDPKKVEVTFSTEIKEIKDETGDVVDTQLFVVFHDAKLIEAVRAFISTEKLYDKDPKLNAETLLQYMPQFEKSTAPPIAPLLKFLREEFGDLTAKVNVMLADGKVSYSLLWAVFSPEVHIASSLRSHQMAAKVTRSKYNHSSWFPSFEVDAIVIKCNGQHFYRDTIRYAIEAFNGLRKFDELPIQPLSNELKEKLLARGKVFRKYGKGAHYLMYTGFIERKNWWSTTLIKADGRVMVDGSSFQRLNPNYGVFSNSPSNDSILPQIPDELLHLTYPTLGGFSFTAKKWGELDLNKLEEIVYDDDAFDRLVLSNEKKKLIRSLVENTQTSFSDIISGKGGGCIFLLHGSPGVGKTLTAEAIAELLHRPLYSVSVGELGTNTDELEKKLREILELASTWNAVILIDEADIFLERRSENDIVRNAMVGIFLRLLEYHQGVLFLTTNRVRCFDEAFHSRISVALKYEDLDREAREKIWTNLLSAAKISGLNAKGLSEFNINGRQIRTTIRLAQSLANSEGVTVTSDHVMATITVAQQFVSDMMTEDALLQKKS